MEKNEAEKLIRLTLEMKASSELVDNLTNQITGMELKLNQISQDVKRLGQGDLTHRDLRESSKDILSSLSLARFRLACAKTHAAELLEAYSAITNKSERFKIMPDPINIETTLNPEELEVLITALQTYYYIQNTSPIGDRSKADLILSAARKLGIYFT